MNAYISYAPSSQPFITEWSHVLREQGIAPMTVNLQLQFGDKIYSGIQRFTRHLD